MSTEPNNPTGIAIFESFAVPLPQGINRDLIQQHSIQLFWEREWYRRRIDEWPTNMIVERPAVRVLSNKDTFATSWALLADSLNWYIEASIMQYTQAGGTRLSNATFKKLVSEPFEMIVSSMFRKYGFSAGRVTQNGAWIVDDRQINLSHLHGQPIPGEVDVLAFHEESKMVFVAECKVLGFPILNYRLRNIALKLGKQDSEGFHSNLQKKIAWFQKTNLLSSVAKENFVGLVVLDRKTPGMIMESDYRVCDLDILEHALIDIYRPHHA